MKYQNHAHSHLESEELCITLSLWCRGVSIGIRNLINSKITQLSIVIEWKGIQKKNDENDE